LKQWHRTEAGRTFLIESVSWSDVWPHVKDFAVARPAPNEPNLQRQVAQTRTWAPRPGQIQGEAIQVASVPYQPRGYAVDFVSIPSQQQPTTFVTGTTYYIPTSYSVSTTATFQPGCTLKYGLNAYLLLYGPISFPTTQQTPVFTSSNDDGFGEDIDGSPSTPAQHASPAIWVYYVTFNTEIKNARIRYAKRGIQYDQNSGVTATHTVRDSLFENITGAGNYGIYVNLPSGPGLTLTGVQKCNVTVPVQVYAGFVSGSMTDAPFCTDKSFAAVRPTDTFPPLTNPPDTMGAVGPNHFVTILNKNMVGVFDKSTGWRVETNTVAVFFSGSSNANLADPRIVYDAQCGRWVACMYDIGTQSVRIAVSYSSDPRPLTSNWYRFNVPVAEAGYFVDFPTMGLDSNGLYIAIRLTQGGSFNPTAWMHKVIPIKKPASCGTITASDIKTPIKVNQNAGYSVLWMQPAVNFDSVGSTAIAWFVGKGVPASGGPIVYGRLQWTQQGGNWTASFLENPWNKSEPVPDAYYDLDNNQGFAMPQKSDPQGTQTPNVLAGSRLQMAIVRNGFLWTAHHVGLDGGDNLYNGGSVDRTGCGWFKMKIKADNTLSLNRALDGADYGRTYDTAGSTPYHYYFPSLSVNSTGDVVMGFSGSKGNEFIGAFYAGGRAASSIILGKPVLVQAGRDYFDHFRWGDYTYTSPDPSNGTLWTIQQYGEIRSNPTGPPENRYGLWITKVRTNP